MARICTALCLVLAASIARAEDDAPSAPPSAPAPVTQTLRGTVEVDPKIARRGQVQLSVGGQPAELRSDNSFEVVVQLPTVIGAHVVKKNGRIASGPGEVLDLNRARPGGVIELKLEGPTRGPFLRMDQLVERTENSLRVMAAHCGAPAAGCAPGLVQAMEAETRALTARLAPAR